MCCVNVFYEKTNNLYQNSSTHESAQSTLFFFFCIHPKTGDYFACVFSWIVYFGAAQRGPSKVNDANSLSDNQEFPSACKRARDRSIIIPRYPPCAPRHVECYNYPRVSVRIRSGSRSVNARAHFRGANIRETRDVAVKGPECLVVARAFAVENGSTFYVPAYGGNVEGARSILPGYIDSGNRLGRNKGPPNPNGRAGGPGRWIIDLIPNG